MQVFDPNALAVLVSIAVLLVVGIAAVLIWHASQRASSKVRPLDVKERVRNAPYHRIGNNIRIVD